MIMTSIPSNSQESTSDQPSPINADKSPAVLATAITIGQRKIRHRLFVLRGRREGRVTRQLGLRQK
jgi:hypothetical protein